MLNYSTIEERERSELLLEMENDAELQAFISNGWTDKRSRLARNLQSYWNYHDELTIESGIPMKNYTIPIPAIPATLRKKYLEKIHAGHQGINSCLKKLENLYSGLATSKISHKQWRSAPYARSNRKCLLRSLNSILTFLHNRGILWDQICFTTRRWIS